MTFVMKIALFVLYILRIQFSQEVYSGFGLQKFNLDLCIQKSFFIRGDQHGSSLLIPGGMLLFPQAYCCTQDHWTVQQLEPPYLHFQISKVILLFSRECTNCFPQCFPRRNARENSQHFKLLTFIEAMSAISDG